MKEEIRKDSGQKEKGRKELRSATTEKDKEMTKC